LFNVGIDIEEINRFSKKKFEENLNFYKKIFTKNEINYCLKKTNPYSHFAVRFCAKEAAIKALDQKILNLQKIEIIIKNNKPQIKLPNKKNGVVSLSHTDEIAIAIVMIFK